MFDDGIRSSELDLLRKLCIPDVCLRLHRVLHESGEYMEVCMTKQRNNEKKEEEDEDEEEKEEEKEE